MIAIDHYPNRLALAKQNIPAAAMFGAWWCPILPRPSAAIHTVFGDPVKLPKIPEPTKEDIKKYHQLYQDGLVAVFNKHRAEFGKADAELEIF